MQNNEISEQFKALGNDTRLEIIKFLATGEKCVCNIFEYLNLSQNLVSHHLGVLRKSGLIIASKEGKWVHYSLNETRIKNLEDLLSKVLLVNKKKSKC